MRVVTESVLGSVLAGLQGQPRVVVSGNFATPWQTVKVLDAVLPEYRLFALNAQVGVPDRDGVTLESPFVGPGMRASSRLRYLPCRLSLVPNLIKGAVPPDVVLIHTSVPEAATLQLGIGAVPDAVLGALRGRRGLTSLVGDVQRRGPRARAGWRPQHGSPGDRVVRVRQRRALQLDRPQSARTDAADGKDQRSGPDRQAADHDIHQRRPGSRPVRPGKRRLGQRHDLLRTWRPNPLRRRRPAFGGRPRDHRAAVVASQGRSLDGGAAPGRPGHLLPAQLLCKEPRPSGGTTPANRRLR
jgi:hypothetical protein